MTRTRLAILQNVGYPNPNRSHFRSMEIWQTADPDGYGRYGWLGKYLDTLTDAAANPVMAISFTQELPLALHGKKAQVPCFASLADLQVMARDPDLERTLKSLAESDERKMDSPAAVVRQSTRTALEALEYLRERVRGYQSQAQYGNDPLRTRAATGGADYRHLAPHAHTLCLGERVRHARSTSNDAPTTAWSIR
jgi:uncharacterized protein (DUF1501 family)